MKEKPILFSTEMVKAILEGRKTQTRRMCKPQPYSDLDERLDPVAKGILLESLRTIRYKIGQILWVRETWAKTGDNFHDDWPGHGDFYYRANDPFSEMEPNSPTKGIFRWRPSIFMPREACRIFLEVADVRIERLQEITEEDAKAEGITDVEFYPDEGFPLSIGHMVGKDDGKTSLHTTRVKAYAALWESINGKGSWEKNPWVWVISFKHIK